MLPSGPHKAELIELLRGLCDDIRAMPLDAALEARLNSKYGDGTEPYAQLVRLLKLGVEEGWVAYVEIEGGRSEERRGRRRAIRR